MPLFMSSKTRIAQLCPQALSSLFIASYDSQAYAPCRSCTVDSARLSLNSLGSCPTENTVSNNSSIVARLFAVQQWLTFSLYHCLATDVVCTSAILLYHNIYMCGQTHRLTDTPNPTKPLTSICHYSSPPPGCEGRLTRAIVRQAPWRGQVFRVATFICYTCRRPPPQPH
jgi:hypothetical protein